MAAHGGQCPTLNRKVHYGLIVHKGRMVHYGQAVSCGQILWGGGVCITPPPHSLFTSLSEPAISKVITMPGAYRIRVYGKPRKDIDPVLLAQVVILLGRHLRQQRHKDKHEAGRHRRITT